VLPILAKTASKPDCNGSNAKKDKKEENSSCNNGKINEKNGTETKETIVLTNKENQPTKEVSLTTTGVISEAAIKDQ